MSQIFVAFSGNPNFITIPISTLRRKLTLCHVYYKWIQLRKKKKRFCVDSQPDGSDVANFVNFGKKGKMHFFLLFNNF
jgi:hypothetical protein